jgi:hypothetical protein
MGIFIESGRRQYVAVLDSGVTAAAWEATPLLTLLLHNL